MLNCLRLSHARTLRQVFESRQRCGLRFGTIRNGSELFGTVPKYFPQTGFDGMRKLSGLMIEV